MEHSIAVITGDIVDSREISAKEREELYLALKNFLDELKRQDLLSAYELFRGDSFQCVLTLKEDSLKVAVMIKAFIKSWVGEEDKTAASKSEKPARGYAPGTQDIRLAIGIGKVDFLKKNSLAHSDGEAFYFSGDALDGLKTVPYKMMIKTFNETFNESAEPAILLLDAVLQKWTSNQAETVLYKLRNMKEEEIAGLLNITQSAVNQRTKTAQWYAIEKTINYFTSTIKQWE